MVVYFDRANIYCYTVNKISRPGRCGQTIKGELDKKFYSKFKKVESKYLKLENKIAKFYFKFEKRKIKNAKTRNKG